MRGLNIFIEFERNSSTSNKKTLDSCESFVMHPLSEVRNTTVKGNFEIGMYSSVNRSILEKNGGISVGSYVSDTVFGAYSVVGSRVSVGGFEHPKDWLSIGAFQWGQSIEHWEVSSKTQDRLSALNKPKYEQTIIGPDCWLGNNSVVLSSVVIGAGAIIGAGCIVTKNIPPYSIVVGNPSRVIGSRFKDSIISELLELKWWELNIEDVSKLPFNDINQVISDLKEIRHQNEK